MNLERCKKLKYLFWFSGTVQERGMDAMMKHLKGEYTEVIEEDEQPIIRAYDLPYVSDWLRRQKWSTYVPFLPSYMYKGKSESSKTVLEKSINNVIYVDGI